MKKQKNWKERCEWQAVERKERQPNLHDHHEHGTTGQVTACDGQPQRKGGTVPTLSLQVALHAHLVGLLDEALHHGFDVIVVHRGQQSQQ